MACFTFFQPVRYIIYGLLWIELFNFSVSLHKCDHFKISSKMSLAIISPRSDQQYSSILCKFQRRHVNVIDKTDIIDMTSLSPWICLLLLTWLNHYQPNQDLLCNQLFPELARNHLEFQLALNLLRIKTTEVHIITDCLYLKPLLHKGGNHWEIIERWQNGQISQRSFKERPAIANISQWSVNQCSPWLP